MIFRQVECVSYARFQARPASATSTNDYFDAVR